VKQRDSSAQGRFGERALDYARYRPQYPPGLIHLLTERCKLGESSSVADVGSGTGIFSRLLLETGAKVFAVEPNSPMRCTAELELAPRGNFVSVNGSAERTGLADESVSLVCCGQAFHWFDPVSTRVEFRRILINSGLCAIFWNFFSPQSAFVEDYVKIEAKFGLDYLEVCEKRTAAVAAIPAFYGGTRWQKHTFSNFQRLDFSELYGRTASASYMPVQDDPAHGPMTEALQVLFEQHEQGGTVRLDYDCVLYLGRFD
jgi:SAM-dependent methyltransferase